MLLWQIPCKHSLYSFLSYPFLLVFCLFHHKRMFFFDRVHLVYGFFFRLSYHDYHNDKGFSYFRYRFLQSDCRLYHKPNFQSDRMGFFFQLVDYFHCIYKNIHCHFCFFPDDILFFIIISLF